MARRQRNHIAEMCPCDMCIWEAIFFHSFHHANLFGLRFILIVIWHAILISKNANLRRPLNIARFKLQFVSSAPLFSAQHRNLLIILQMANNPCIPITVCSSDETKNVYTHSLSCSRQANKKCALTLLDLLAFNGNEIKGKWVNKQAKHTHTHTTQIITYDDYYWYW